MNSSIQLVVLDRVIELQNLHVTDCMLRFSLPADKVDLLFYKFIFPNAKSGRVYVVVPITVRVSNVITGYNYKIDANGIFAVLDQFKNEIVFVAEKPFKFVKLDQ